MDTQQPKRGRLVVAVDLGTTSSAVSYVLVPEGKDPKDVSPCAIEMVSNWPICIKYRSEESMQNEVPTAVTYPRGWNFKTHCDPRSVASMPDSDEYVDDSELLRIDDDEDEGADDQDPTSPRWGYQVHRELGITSTHNDPSKRPAVHFKPLFGLIKSEKKLRRDGTMSLKSLHDNLEDKKSIKVKEMYLRVTTDFLIFVLQHCKNEILQKKFELVGSTEVVICVLDDWPQSAFHKMQSCMTVAMKQVQFPGVTIQDDSINRVFLVSEPEAAATFMLTYRNDVQADDTFVIVDAGGGTVDAVTYTATGQAPLRIKRMEVEPTGDCCGSTLLNMGFRELLHGLLDTETYLESDGSTIDGIIEAFLFKDFEYNIKPTYNVYTTRNDYRLDLRGLRGDRHRDFENNTLIIRANKLKRIFLNVFERAAKVLIDQLTRNARKGISVNRVVIIGGFASNESLIRYLTGQVKKFNHDFDQQVEVHVPEDIQRGVVINAVATGAVYRALDQDNGPVREARSSYGLVRYEPRIPKHGKQRGLISKITSEEWIKCMHWVVKKGDLVSPNQRWPYRALFQFPFYQDDGSMFRGPFDCEQDIYMSDTANKNHYKDTHKFNKNTSFVGTLVFNVDRLIEAGCFPIRDSIYDKAGGKIQEKHYEVDVEYVFIVQGLNMTCTVTSNGVTLDTLRINIAAGFLPSTK